MSTPALNPLVEKMRAKYPGAYDDLDDATLTKKVLAKHPEYSDLAVPPLSSIKPPQMNMLPSMLGQALNPNPNGGAAAIANPQQPAEQFALQNPAEQGKLAAASAIGAAGSLPGAVPAIARMAKAAWPATKGLAKTAAITSATEAAIQGAKKLPVVGPMVSQIPGIDYLPFLIGGIAGGGKEGKGKEPVYPNTPEGPNALPEQLNPALASEARTLPGQISKEVIRPKAQATAESIPPRSGLALPPAPETSPLPQALQPRTTPSEYGPAKTDFNGKVPADNLGFNFAPAKDYGNAARTDVEQKMGPQPRGNQLDDLLRNAVGNNPVKPGVAMRDQMKASVPEGHTAVESKAMKSFKYDPDAQELHVVNPSDGKTYIYGDVSPEQMQTFQNADSKGRALGAIRNSNPYVAYIPAGGSRIAVKPAAGRSATPQSEAPAPPDDNLMQLLKGSLAQAKQKKN